MCRTSRGDLNRLAKLVYHATPILAVRSSQHAAAKWLVENRKLKMLNMFHLSVLFVYANHVQQDADIAKKLMVMTGVLDRKLKLRSKISNNTLHQMQSVLSAVVPPCDWYVRHKN
jgi:hypothetical protein